MTTTTQSIKGIANVRDIKRYGLIEASYRFSEKEKLKTELIKKITTLRGKMYFKRER